MEVCGDGGDVWGNGVESRGGGGRLEVGECNNITLSGKTPIPNI